MNKFDVLIVGAGFAGSVFAYEAKRRGANIAIIEKRKHIGGNAYTKNVQGVDQHVYGSHILNSNNKFIWNYIKQFTEFNSYKHFGITSHKNVKYSFPINLMTFQQLFGVSTPKEAQEVLERERIDIANPSNFEDYIVSKIGPTLYETLYRGYSRKQWNRW